MQVGQPRVGFALLDTHGILRACWLEIQSKPKTKTSKASIEAGFTTFQLNFALCRLDFRGSLLGWIISSEQALINFWARNARNCPERSAGS